MADGWVQLKPGDFTTHDGVEELNRMLQIIFENIPGDTDTVRDYKGYGVPSFSAGVGSTYRRLDGGVGSTFYVKESGGWAAK